MGSSGTYTECISKFYSGINAWLGDADDIPELSWGTRLALWLGLGVTS